MDENKADFSIATTFLVLVQISAQKNLIQEVYEQICLQLSASVGSQKVLL